MEAKDYLAIIKNCKYITVQLYEDIADNIDEYYEKVDFPMLVKQLEEANEILADNNINTTIGLDGKNGGFSVTVNGKSYNGMEYLLYYALEATFDRVLGNIIRSTYRSRKLSK